MSVVALAVACFGAIVAAGQSGRHAPPALPVVTVDGLPGQLVTPTALPQRPSALPLLPVTRLDDGGRALLDAPHAASLTFARPLPVHDVLLLLFRGTPFSVVVDRAVVSTFVGELKDVTLRQALESVLATAASDYDMVGTIVRVFPRKPEVRVFSIDHLQAPSGGTDFLSDLGAGVQSLLSASGRVHVTRKASLIQVTDFADRLEVVAAYIESAQLRVNRQIRLDAHVFEVARPDGRPLDWAALANQPGTGLRRLPGSAAWRVDALDALLGVLGGTAALRPIASPTMVAMNNEPAVLHAEDAQGEIRLSITPQISADDIIHLHVSPSYASGRAPQTGGPLTASFDTVVRVASGDTVVIAGVMRLRDDDSLAELVFLLTPTRVSPLAAASEGGR